MNHFPANGNDTLRFSNASIHVLLAEDNLLLQRAMSIVLTKKGFTVYVAKNGNQAVEQMKLHPIDIVLMAINMPEMSGVEATLAIRSFNLYTPIIAFTSYDETSMIQDIKKAGMNGFLSKYASPDHIYHVIMQHTESAKKDY